MFEEGKESRIDWDRAFFARVVAAFALPPLVCTLLTAFFVPPVPGGAKEHLVIVAGAIALAPLLTAFAISHLPYLRERRSNRRWHFSQIETILIAAFWAILLILMLLSALGLFHLKQ